MLLKNALELHDLAARAEANVRALMQKYLDDVPFAETLTPTSSLFDQVIVRHGGNRVMLQEHFRCMPEIIRFSDDLCYHDTPLIPLRQYPSYPLPGIDSDAWEAAAWDDLCDLLRKNKTKTGNPCIRADLTGSGPIANPTGALRQLREMFLDHHRRIRANRARAPELGFLIDRLAGGRSNLPVTLRFRLFR